MKKFFVLVLAIVLVSCLLLPACAEPEPEPVTPTTPTTPTTPAEPAKPAEPVEPAKPAEPVEPAKPEEPEKPIELTFSFHAPPQASLAKAVLIPWAEAIQEATEGRVIITQHAGGSLVGAADAYDALVTGICDIAQIATEEYPGQFPLSGIHTLPFMYPTTEIAGIASHELMNKYCMDTELKDVKLMVSAPLHGGNYLGNKPVEKLEDFQGLKIRGPGKIDAAILTALGATPVNITTGEVFSALDRGLLDGTIFTWSGALAFGIKDVTKNRTEIGLSRGVHFIMMNPQVFAELPPDIQKIFNDFSTPEYSRKLAADHGALEPGGRGAIEGSDKAAGNPPIVVLSPEERARWEEAVQVVRDDWANEMEAEGLPGKAMLDDAASLVEKYSK